MGIVDLLLRLPGGAVYLQDFYELRMTDKEVPIDAAGLLWACVYKHAKDYLEGNLLPALIEMDTSAQLLPFHLSMEDETVFGWPRPFLF